MQMVSLHEISNPIFWENLEKYFKILFAEFFFLSKLMCLKTAEWVVNSVHSYQTLHSVPSDQGLQFTQVCLSQNLWLLWYFLSVSLNFTSKDSHIVQINL